MTDERCIFRIRTEPPRYAALDVEDDDVIATLYRNLATVFDNPQTANAHRGRIAQALRINPADLILVSPEERK